MEKYAERRSVTVQQMAEVDRIMTEELDVDLLQMMENAGRHLATVARTILGGDASGKRILVLAGSGNNGGGGLAAARHLVNWGADVRVLLTQEAETLSGVPGKQASILQRMGIALAVWKPDLQHPDFWSELALIVDALVGYGLKGPPREPAAGLIRHANAAGKPIVALDLPSGLDGDTGEPYEPCIRASTTVTLALPKVGLLAKAAKSFVGKLYVADIGVPPPVYRQLGLDVGKLFRFSDLLQVDSTKKL